MEQHHITGPLLPYWMAICWLYTPPMPAGMSTEGCAGGKGCRQMEWSQAVAKVSKLQLPCMHAHTHSLCTIPSNFFHPLHPASPITGVLPLYGPASRLTCTAAWKRFSSMRCSSWSL